MTFRHQGYITSLIVLFLLNQASPSFPAGPLVKTPSDFEGPFYPVERQADEDNDLIHVAGRNHAAQGEILHLSGRVVDQDGHPFAKAVVEIWQADPNGRYNDKRDRSHGRRDPDFQYWGMTVTREDGSYSFTTLIPGDYKPRQPHIHFRVWLNKELLLTSQIFFRNLNGLFEGILTQPTENALQTVDLHKNKEGAFDAFFQIVMER